MLLCKRTVVVLRLETRFIKLCFLYSSFTFHLYFSGTDIYLQVCKHAYVLYAMEDTNL
jgi:hypothetical protein